MESSLRDQVREYITEFSDNVRKYFLSLSAIAENATIDKSNSPKQIVEQMAIIDKKLQEAVKHIESHQIRQQQIIKVQEEIQQHNIALLEIIQKLGSVRDELDLSLEKAKTELKAMKYATDSNVQFTDVLAYASKLSKYTSAPPNFDNTNIKVDFEKPYPDEERMRRGLLYWQNASQQRTEEKFESSDSEASSNEEMEEIHINKQAEDADGDPFWILDLNPDMQP
ncbi:vitamin-D-receptor interacting mediator subunit 4-domain-containing protein [Cokeromyces recurvatus]|uniref:vitamin-D-receptor interacting mediator subunit 4-domain-containing protein n=1 Tax=Cokeromyces recurvatus TaxID=90255 RepID=UPI002220857A|nr:vitamin-D-receptor interacting mediator subunit 4-domain-containing protein [Cokeromyces recurvatus]KAI7904953.1 vitamin-D-receptor interacting mediator subunit 4-domain-containing protein [Cokeromyces recurvatus]